MKRVIPSEKIKAAYIDGICQFVPLPVISATMTFPQKLQKKDDDKGIRETKSRIKSSRDVYSLKTVKKRLLRFVRIINTHVFGRRFREKNLRLKGVAVIEGQHKNPHIHLIIQGHRRLGPRKLKRLWKECVSPRSSIKALFAKGINTIDDQRGVSDYLTKNVRWGEVETEPYFFGPKDTDKGTAGGSHA